MVGQRHVARLIELYGQDAYAEFDAKAKSAMDKALAAKDVQALLAVEQHYPHSQYADDMLFAGAEPAYREALARPELDREAREFLRESQVCLAELPELPQQPAGPVRQGRPGDDPVAAEPQAGPADLPAGPPVGAEGRPGEVRRLRRAGGRARSPGSSAARTPRTTPAACAEPPPPLGLPLEVVYTVKDPAAEILRDGQGRPVQFGPRVMVISGGEVLCLDTQHSQYEVGKAIQWKGLTGIVAKVPAQPLPVSNAARLVGQLTSDGRQLAVATPEQLALLETQGGRAVYQKKLADIDVYNPALMAGDGDYMVFAERAPARLKCVNLVKGTLAWFAQPPAGKVPQPQGWAGTLQASAGLVLCQDSQARWLGCYDLATGKPLYEGQNDQGVEGYITPGGKLLVAQGTDLSLIDPRGSPSQVVWTQVIPGGRVMLLGAGADNAAVSFAGAQPRTVIVGLERGQIVTSLEDSGTYGPFSPQAAVFDGDRVFVLCNSSPRGRPRGAGRLLHRHQAHHSGGGPARASWRGWPRWIFRGSAAGRSSRRPRRRCRCSSSRCPDTPGPAGRCTTRPTASCFGWPNWRTTPRRTAPPRAAGPAASAARPSRVAERLLETYEGLTLLGSGGGHG